MHDLTLKRLKSWTPQAHDKSILLMPWRWQNLIITASFSAIPDIPQVTYPNPNQSLCMVLSTSQYTWATLGKGWFPKGNLGSVWEDKVGQASTTKCSSAFNHFLCRRLERWRSFIPLTKSRSDTPGPYGKLTSLSTSSGGVVAESESVLGVFRIIKSEWV